jgi:hypothetical protein
MVTTPSFYHVDYFLHQNSFIFYSSFSARYVVYDLCMMLSCASATISPSAAVQ